MIGLEVPSRRPRPGADRFASPGWGLPRCRRWSNRGAQGCAACWPPSLLLRPRPRRKQADRGHRPLAARLAHPHARGLPPPRPDHAACAAPGRPGRRRVRDTRSAVPHRGPAYVSTTFQDALNRLFGDLTQDVQLRDAAITLQGQFLQLWPPMPPPHRLNPRLGLRKSEDRATSVPSPPGPRTCGPARSGAQASRTRPRHVATSGRPRPAALRDRVRDRLGPLIQKGNLSDFGTVLLRQRGRRVDPDTGERARFTSAILPPWCRKTRRSTRCCRCCTYTT